MRILQVVTLLSPDGAYGGPARVALNQSAELRSRGHDVVLAAATRGFSSRPTQVGGVPVELFDARQILPGTGFAGLGSPGLVRWFRGVAGRFDVVHIHFGRDLVGIPMAAMARRRGIPYVLQTHGMVIPSRHPLAAPLDALWTRRVLRGADSVFYLTDQERDQLAEVAGTPGLSTSQLTPLINGVPEYSVVRGAVGRAEVLFVSRLQERKRPQTFVKMAKALLNEGFDATFTLVGPDEGEGSAVHAAIGDEERIRWEGPLPPAAIPDRLAQAAVYVLPSVQEPYPMAVLEAMAVGLPIVLSADCGLAPVVQKGGCGIVVHNGLAGFVNAVRAILADPVLACEMGRRGQQVVRKDFSMSAIADRLMDVYSQTVGK